MLGVLEHFCLPMSDDGSVGWWLSHAAMLLAEPAMLVEGPERYYSFQTLHPSRSTEVSMNPYLSLPFGGLFFTRILARAGCVLKSFQKYPEWHSAKTAETGFCQFRQ
jgi:hypothetical protein